MTDQDLRERLVTLEVEMRYMRDKFDELNKTVTEVRDLLTQAKGARGLLIAAATAIGFLGGISITIAKWFGVLR